MGIITSLNEELNKDKFNEVIRKLIDDEIEAIEGYEKAITELLKTNISSEKYDECYKVFEHIIPEEQEHIEELEKLLK